MSTKKRGLFSRKPHAAPAVVEVPASPAPSSTSTTTPIASWPTSPSPPLPSDSQGIFPPRANSSTWNSVGGTLGDHNGSAGGVTEDGRKVSMEASQRLNRSGSQKSTDAGEKHHGGMRSFFGRNKRSTLPAQPREVPSGIPVPVKSGGMPRSQSSGVLSNSTRGDEQDEQSQRPPLRSPASHNTQLSYSSPSLNFTPASPTHPRIRAHHEEQARLAAAAAGLPSPNSFTTPARSPLSPTSTPLPFSPASSHFSQALAPYDDSGSLRSRSDGITPGSTPTSSRRTPLPTPSPTGEQPQLSPLFTSTPLVSSSPSANRSPTYGNTLPSSPSTLAPPFRVRVFIDHPTTEPLYITVNPGTETLRSLKHKILRVDNERFVQFRQARRPPVETKWDIHPTVGEGEEGRAGRAGDKTFDFDRRIQLFRVSVDWLVVSKTKRNYEKTRTFQSVLSSHPSTPIVTSSETDFLPLLNLFPATPASAAARLKGLIEIVVRIVPAERESVPVLVSFSDMPDQPVVVDVEKGWTVHAVKEAIGKARGLAVRIVGGGRSQLGGEDFFLFKASQPRHTSTPLPYDIDHFEGLAPETLFDDEDQEFATHPFVVEAGLDLPERLLRRVELVAFLIADMEEDFRDGLKMKTHHVNDTTLRAGYDYGVSPATAIMNNARHVSPNRMDPARPSSRGSNNSSVNSGKRPTRDPRENGNGDRNGNGNGNGSHHHHRGDPRDQREQQQQRSPRTSPSTRSPHGLPSPPFSSGSSSERHHSHQQQPSYSSSSSSRNLQQQQQQQQHHSQQPSPQQYQQQQQQQASSYEKQLRQHQQQQQQAAEISPPITPSGSLHQVTAPRNVPKVNGSYTPPASFSPTTSPLGSPNRMFDSSSSEPGPPSPSSYKTALANAEDWLSPRLVSNLASHQRSPDLDPVEHSSTFDGLEDVLKSYEGGSSAGSLGLSDAGGLDGLKQMLEKPRSGSVEEERKQEVADVEAAGEEGEEKQEEMERRHEEIEEEERDCVDPHWTRSPGGGLSLGPVVEEDEPLSPASSTFGAKLKQPAHSRTSSSSSSTTSPLLLVHIRKPYAGPFTDTTSFASDDISPTSCPIPLPPIHPTRNASDASDYSQTSFATTPESPARVVRQGSSLPDGSEVDRSGNTSPIGSERTVVPSHPSARNLSTSSSDDDRSTVQPPSPAAVAQRFRFASIEATSVPPRTNSPTRIKYAHSMAANNRRGSTNRKGSYVIREGLATGYPLRSALKGGKAKAKAARPVASVVRRVSSRDIALNGRNISLNGGRNSILLGTNSPTKRNPFLVGSGRFPSNTRTGSNSSLRTSVSSSAGTTSPRMTNGVNGAGGVIHSILRKPTPQSPNLNNGNNSVDLASLPPSPAQSPPPQEFDGDRSFSRMGSMCAEGYAVIGGAMFSVTLRPMDEKGAMVMGTREFKAAGPLFKLESAH